MNHVILLKTCVILNRVNELNLVISNLSIHMKEKEVNITNPDNEIKLHLLSIYPATEDIYNKNKNKQNIDPEDILSNKKIN